MNPLHNDEQFPNHLQSSSNDKQPTEEPTLIEKPSTDEDKTLQESSPKVEPPEQTGATSNETVIRTEPAKDENKTLQEHTPKVEPPAEEQTSTISDELTHTGEPETRETASPLNQAPIQEASVGEMTANQDTNEVPPPPMNPEAFPNNPPYPAEGIWQSYPPAMPPPSPMWQSYPPPVSSTPPPVTSTPPMWQSYPPPVAPTPPIWQSYPPPVSSTLPPVAPTPPKPPGRLARPLPLWAFLGGIGLIVALLVVLHLTGSDWGNGAANASGAAAFIGIMLVLALIVRSLNWKNSSGMASPLNPTRTRQYITSFLCIIVIFVYSGVSQALVPTLHIAQGRSLEGQKQWQAAINEYQLGQEKAPDGQDLARAYTLWGQTLNKAQHYNEALTKFGIVIGQFNSNATRDQVKQAQSGDISARLALAQQNMQAKNYYAATSSYDAILRLSYCDITCSNRVDPLDATAYYKVAEEYLQTKNYMGAVAAFDVILTKFPSTPEAKQLHGDMAKALLGEGQNTRASNCSSAIPTYQRLAREYGDTPEGQSATQDLNAPQTITGNFTNVETTGTVYNQMGLTHGLTGGMTQDQVFAAWDAAGMKTDIQGNGDFSFSGVPQGDYDLIWYGTKTTSDATYIYYYKYVEFVYLQTSSQPKYVAHIGPLCPVNIGQMTNSSSGLFQG